MVLLCLAAVLAAAGPGWAADILFSTFVNTQSNGIARDATFDKSGNLYIAGGGAGFERADLTFDYKTERGGDSRGRFYPYDVFVQKYGAHGRLLWTVRLGGEGYDRAYALEIDRQGNILVAGRAGAGFPTTAGAYQEHFGGNSKETIVRAYGKQDGFVVKLDGGTGPLLWSTYIGGSSGELIRDIAAGPDGAVNIALTNVRSAAGQPISGDGARKQLAGRTDAIFARLAGDGRRLLYGTFIGSSGLANNDGSNPSIIADAKGDINMVMMMGSDGAPTTRRAWASQRRGDTDLYLVKFDGASGGRRIKAATYFGTKGGDYLETHNLAIDAQGNFIVAAATNGRGLPTGRDAAQRAFAGGKSDGFAAVISADGRRVIAATYLGGKGADNLEGIAYHQGRIYVSGKTSSQILPAAGISLKNKQGGGQNALMLVLPSSLTRIIDSAYLGGSQKDQGRALAVAADGRIAVGGSAGSADFPVKRASDLSKQGRSAPFVTVFHPIN